MNWTIETIKEDEIIGVIIEGDFSAPDHLRMIEEIISDKGWRSGTSLIFDGRKIRFGENAFDLIWHAAQNLSKHDSLLGDGKIAVLLKPSDFIFGKEFEMLTDEKVSGDIRIFVDEKEATRWLGF